MRSEGRDIQYDIAFGGQFFAMIDAAQYGMEINNNTVNEFIKIGYDIIRRLKQIPPQRSGIRNWILRALTRLNFMASRAGKMQMSETWSHSVICRRTALPVGQEQARNWHACTKPVR